MFLTVLASAAALACGSFDIDPKASQPFAATEVDHAPGSCQVQRAPNGMLLPDPACTPGAINPTVTGDVLRDPGFRTACIRDKVTSAARKRKVYVWYGITPPANNKGANQTCELDHLISIGLGGADTLDNLWPQCDGVEKPIGEREFKIKDSHAEQGLMRQIKAGAELEEIQRRIAEDWTQFIQKPPRLNPKR